jgi:hypothetical protein
MFHIETKNLDKHLLIIGKGGHPGCIGLPLLGQKSAVPVGYGVPYSPASVWMISTNSASVARIC